MVTMIPSAHYTPLVPSTALRQVPETSRRPPGRGPVLIAAAMKIRYSAIVAISPDFGGMGLTLAEERCSRAMTRRGAGS